jgi:NADH-quinone oxidoreductase subunit B
MASAVVDRLWLDVAGQPVALHVLELGLACCGIEVREARRAAELAGALGAEHQARTGSQSTTVLNVLVVAGTVTTALAPVLVQAWEAVAEPRAVLAFGACAATGGPYWDSYAVLPGAHELVPVTAWVAGCPPRPEDLQGGLAEVLRARQ